MSKLQEALALLEEIDDFDDDSILDDIGQTLLVDGDIIAYRPCCVLNEDSDSARKAIIRNIKSKIQKLTRAAGCNKFRIFLTKKKNFRNAITDDYKANRKDTERPINLEFAKKHIYQHLNGEFIDGLEADDLLAINQTDKTVIWSLDKDLKMVPGKHLDDATMKVYTVEPEGMLEKVKHNGKNKINFNGNAGFMFQLLIGDSTDNILGCGLRVSNGKGGLRRKGMGPMEAYDLLEGLSPTEQLLAVIDAYSRIYEDDAIEQLEKQGRLLFMSDELEGSNIKLWTADGRKESLDLSKL